MGALVVAAGFFLAVLSCGCSPRTFVLHNVADAVSSGGEGFTTDDDPELVRDSLPFALKAMESLLEEQPDHRGLLTSLARGFTQYSAAFVWQDAVEASDPEDSRPGRVRARRLYLRAREYGLRGLSVGRPGFREEFAADPAKAASKMERDDVPLLFWTGVSWSLAISTAQDDPEMLADLPRCEVLMRRALALREDFDGGAIHEYFIAFEGGRPEAMGGSAARAKRHFERAMQLSRGRKVSPLVTLAETVSVRAQDRKEFLELLDRALSFDARGEAPEYRMANLLVQRKARWLKGRVDDLFLE
ncbi:MAG TPA: TRAP transporter TatT component family protein [Candidatus Limnocylindrales bacterium]|nr:TRAP transporter TatT component family protein [Candidatus Limnocylindrales bacterium]